jgi:uncharacterized membrane protein
MDHMTDPQRVVFARLSAEFNDLSQQLARVSALLAQVRFSERADQPASVPAPVPPLAAPGQHWAPGPFPPAEFRPAQFPPADLRPPQLQPPPDPGYVRSGISHPTATPPRVAQPASGEARQGWIGKALAIAGVVVTLVGVVLLLVLAAQAGVLRPEVRVLGGFALSAGLVTMAARQQRRPGGRVGAIALAATGIAAGYLDVIAMTTIYGWIPSPAALLIAALLGGGGLTLARRWDSQHLAVLVLLPLLVLAPVITDGMTVLLIGFMLALSASALPIQIGRDWAWMHAARVGAVTMPLVVALAAAEYGGHMNSWLLGSACGLAALLAIVSALVLLPTASNRATVALTSAAGMCPVLLLKGAVDHWFAALLAAALAAALLTLAIAGDRLPGGDRVVTRIWSVMTAAAALIAVTAAFRGEVAAPVLLAIALAVAVVGRREAVARWIAVGLGVIGFAMSLGNTPPDVLTSGTVLPLGSAVSTLVASVLAVAWAAASASSMALPENFRLAPHRDESRMRMWWIAAGLVTVYSITAFTVTGGVLIGGPGGGFFAGQVAATICWISLAAVLFGVALRVGRERQAAPIAGGLALTFSAMAKLFLFDLGTLDGIFRVVAFMITGLILLAMGAGYARSLAVHEDRQN